MLVLARKRSEEIKVGESITIKVVRIDGNVVRIGIDAPGLKIMRREVLERKPKSTPK